MILSVAEKPSVAKELAKIISGDGPMHRRPGFSQYNQIFEIPNCSFRGSPASMKITSVTGHMMELEFDKAFKSWNSCQPVDLFTAPVFKTVKKESEDIQRTLREEAKKCNILLLWLDCDLEGENICFEVIEVCKAANPRLDIYRARFSALIPRDIFRALQLPERPNSNFNDAVEARQEIDLRLGAAFTRFQTLRLQNKFDNIANGVISYGPCQFPTLGFVVERHLQIQAFKPENYWSLSCEYEGHDEGSGGEGAKIHCTLGWDRGSVYDKFACAVLMDLCMQADLSVTDSERRERADVDDHDDHDDDKNERHGGGSRVPLAVVTKCEARPTTRVRPVPMNTIEMQKRASRFLRLSSERTMHVAEALYQRGIMSYPRTETDFFKEGFELQPLLEEHTGHSQWGAYVQNMLNVPGKFRWPSPGGHDDQAHPPIHPTKCVELDSLQDADERGIYDLVTRHFLACCSTDGVGNMTNISVSIPAVLSTSSSSSSSSTSSLSSEGAARAVPGPYSESFSTSGLMIIERNWLDVYGKYESWSAKKVPRFQVGDTFIPKSITMTSGRTQAPPPLSESDLISDMDKNGIGTDATIAAHITTIQQRAYVKKDDQNRFVPTKLGLALIEGYNEMGYQLNKPFLRASMEADCKKIASGELRGADVVVNCLRQMKDCFITCNRDAAKLDAAMAKHFSAYGSDPAGSFVLLQRNLSTCGVCRDGMDLRVKVEGGGGGGGAPAGGAGGQGEGSTRHLYCATCQVAHMLPSRGRLLQHELSCPICNFQVLIVRNTDTQKDHTICPHCFKNPPPSPISEEGGGGDFRCFTCAFEGCPLAGRMAGANVDVCPCTVQGCGQNMRLKKNSKGWLLACSKSACTRPAWWLPKTITAASVSVSDVCESCSRSCGREVHKLKLQFNLQMLAIGVEPEVVACVCCDELWSSRLRIEPFPLAGTMTGSGGAGVAVRHHIQPQYPSVPGTPVGAMTGTGTLNGNGPTPHTHNRPGASLGSGAGAAVYGGGGGGGAQGVPGWGNFSMDPPQSPWGGSSSSSAASGGGSDYMAAAQGTGFKVKGSSSSRVTGGRGGGGPPAARNDYGSNSFSNSNSGVGGGGGGGGGDSNPPCQCGLPCRVQTVSKDGPNKGRKFYVCTKSREEQCKMFAWVDETPHGGGGGGGSGGGSSSSSSSSSSSISRVCECGMPVVTNTVQKDGPNKGRLFMTCSVKRGGQNGCNFFEFVNDGPPPSSTPSYRGSGGSDVTCSRCRQVGHYARNCPNK